MLHPAQNIYLIKCAFLANKYLQFKNGGLQMEDSQVFFRWFLLSLFTGSSYWDLINVSYGRMCHTRRPFNHIQVFLRFDSNGIIHLPRHTELFQLAITQDKQSLQCHITHCWRQCKPMLSWTKDHQQKTQEAMTSTRQHHLRQSAGNEISHFLTSWRV